MLALLVLLQVIGPGDGRVPIVLAWDGARQMGVSYMVEHAGRIVPCSASDERVIPGEARCKVWMPPGPQTVRLRAESGWLPGVPCPSGTTRGRGTCVTPWSDPVTVGAGNGPGPYRVTFAGEIK